MKKVSYYKSVQGQRLVKDLYDKTLANWPVPYETFNINTRYGNTFVIGSGEKTAKPLILLHGLSANAVSWIGDIRKYAELFRTYAIDIPGEPGRSAAQRPKWNSPAYAEWLEDVLNYLNINKPSIVGVSYGGWITLKFAVYHPECVEKLVLVSSAGIIPVKPAFLIQSRMLSLMGDWGARKQNRILLGEQNIPRGMLQSMDTTMTHFKSRQGNMPIFTDDELKRLTTPVLLLGGLKDSVQNINKVANRLKKLSPDITINIFPEEGHILLNSASVIIPFLISG
jgi:pimeloyl-ACP methyl ester carboxylesterase